ncbi:MAG: metallophosphoesterase [Candidatus Lokiarchaeota archaeon]
MNSTLISPNLGNPIFLKIDEDLKNTNLKATLLFVSDTENRKEFESSIRYLLVLIPILEYKWKLTSMFKKSRLEKPKKVSFWTKIKRFFTRKKRRREKEKEQEKLEKLQKLYEEKLEKLKPRAYRGDPIIPVIMSSKFISIKDINSLEYIKKEFYTPQKYLLKHEVFENLKNFFEVEIEYELTEEVIEFLRDRNFVMFDVIQERGSKKNRINYHSLILTKQKWENFNFIHATDLHLAERNDRMYSLIKQWYKALKLDKLESIVSKNNGDKSVFNPISLEKRLINPNNQYRKFIKNVNRRVLNNELDFVILTGDLVDFTILSRFPKDLRKLFLNDYEHSNWKVFKSITLNLPQKQREGMLEGEEILAPILTTIGNHDYRPNHYDIRWAGMYKKLGLKLDEALALNDKLLAVPITALTKTNKALKGYWSEINISMNFSLKIGKNLLIFLNSGADSWRNLSDLVSGHPSLTGISNKQIKYLENLLNHSIVEGDNVFLFIHGPPINSSTKVNLLERIKKTFGKNIKIKLDEFKESLLEKMGKKTSKIRIDDKFNVKFGTFSNNWEKMVKFCKDYCVLTSAGHTHALREYRLGNPELKTTVFDAPPFNLKKIENPASIFYDIYSELYTNSKDIEENGPFVVQTPALGLGGFKNFDLVGGFREIIIKDGKLNSFRVNYLDK